MMNGYSAKTKHEVTNFDTYINFNVKQIRIPRSTWNEVTDNFSYEVIKQTKIYTLTDDWLQILFKTKNNINLPPKK